MIWFADLGMGGQLIDSMAILAHANRQVPTPVGVPVLISSGPRNAIPVDQCKSNSPPGGANGDQITMKNQSRPIRSLIFLSLATLRPRGARRQPSSFDKFLEDNGIIVRQSLANKNFNNEPAAHQLDLAAGAGLIRWPSTIAIRHERQGAVPFLAGRGVCCPRLNTTKKHPKTDRQGRDTLKAGFNMNRHIRRYDFPGCRPAGVEPLL